MMPTAKKKLGGMGGLFMRQTSTGSDGSMGGPGASPRAGVVGLPATPAPVNGIGSPGRTQQLQSQLLQFQRELPQLQPPPEIVTARQDTPAAVGAGAAGVRSIPVPKGSRFANSANANQPATAMSMPPPAQHAQHFHPMQRTRTSASDPARELPRGPHNAWEDSTVGSMFGDTDSRAASDRLRGHPALQGAAHGRHYSDTAYHRAQQAPPQPVRNNHHAQQQQQQQPTHDENLPFVIGENGLLKVIRQPGAQSRPSIADLNMNMNNGVSSGGMLHDQAAAVKMEDVYQDEHQAYDTTPTKLNALRRTKLPHRDAREARRDSFSDRAGGYSSDAQSLGMSPERPGEAGNQIEKVRLEERLQERARRERERERDREQERERDRDRERELHHKRSTVFENLTPVLMDEPTFNDTRAAVMMPSSEGSPRASSEEAGEALQLTPRATRKQSQQLQQQFVPQTTMPGGLNLMGEGPLGRTGSRRLKEAALPTVTGTSKETQSQRKRRHSLDYNDAELHAMSYSDLRAQNFDYDPQVAALQQQQQIVQAAPATAMGSLEDRLAHFKGKIGQDQHEFFTRLPVNEWEDAGDWFLGEFAGVVKRMKVARRAKRALIEGFESEISAREEAVRGKVEGIARTLEDLKHEGVAMMAGKEAELEF